MLTLVPALTPRTLSLDAPACRPCPWPASRPTPEPAPRYSIAACTHARMRCQQVAQVHPTWPQSRVRASIARELNVATCTLRYLLRRADEALATPDAVEPPATAQAA